MHKSRTARRSRIGRYAYFLSYYIQSRLGRKRPLLGGMKITHACNLTCTHCPFWKKKAESLSFTQAISALEALHRRGVRILVIEGGEPFLWRDGEHDLSDIVDEAKKLFFSVGVTTNWANRGTLIGGRHTYSCLNLGKHPVVSSQWPVVSGQSKSKKASVFIRGECLSPRSSLTDPAVGGTL